MRDFRSTAAGPTNWMTLDCGACKAVRLEAKTEPGKTCNALRRLWQFLASMS
jgi:hypothetical protein